MSSPPEPQAGLLRLGARILAALPPAFLLLLALNLAVLYFLDQQAEGRIELLNKIIERCLPR